MSRWIVAAAYLALACPAHAVELRVHYSAIERMLAQQVFTQEGKRYVRGGPPQAGKQHTCTFAYLENPHVSGEQGRLLIKARFSGRSAWNLFGKCVGLGDSFDVAIAAVPAYRDGHIEFSEVQVNSNGRDGVYIRAVRQELARSLKKDFRYNVLDDAKRLLGRPPDSATYKQEISKFQIPRVEAAGDALVLTVDFVIAVK